MAGKRKRRKTRPQPTTRRQLERMHTVFRTTLLMITAALPQFGNLTLTKDTLDEWYEWFYGPDIAGRHPAPDDRTLLYAERNAWRRKTWSMGAPPSRRPSPMSAKTSYFGNGKFMNEWRRRSGRNICLRISPPTFWGLEGKGHGKVALTKGKGKGQTKPKRGLLALQDKEQDEEGEENGGQEEEQKHRPSKGLHSPSKGKGKSHYRPIQHQWDKPQKGYTKGKSKGGKKGGKSKGKGKSKDSWPFHWAFSNPKKVPYCRDYHVNNSCAGSCGRSQWGMGMRCPPHTPCTSGLPTHPQVTTWGYKCF